MDPINIAQQVKTAQAMVAQTQAQGDKPFAGSSYQAAITPASLTPQNPISLPVAPSPTIPTVGTIPTLPDTGNVAKEGDWLTQLFAATPQPESGTKAYNDLYKSSGIEQSSALVNDKRAATLAAQGKLGALNAQLAQLNAEAQAIPIQVQQGAQEGGANVTKGGLAPITTAALRNNALRAIPIQAQVLGAQAEVAAAQGNQQLAQDMLQEAQAKFDHMFQVHMQDVQNQYEYNREVRDRLYAYMTNKEKERMDAIQRADDRAFTVKQNAISDQKELARFAIQQGQSSLAARIAELNPDSPTFNQDIAKLQGQITLPPASSSYELKTVNGVDMIFNTKTGTLTPAGTSSPLPDAKKLESINDFNAILNSPTFNNVMGVEGIIRRNIPNTPEYALKAQIETLVSRLALAARGQLKGQGQVSDFEGKLLRDAQTTFRFNMSAEEGKKALVQARGAIITSSGLPAMVKVTNTSGAAKTGFATQEEINDLIQEGNIVEYQ